MSTEFEDREKILSSSWTTNLSAEQDPRNKTLRRLATETYSEFEHLPWGYQGDPLYLESADDDINDEWDATGREFFSSSRMYRKATIDERREMMRAWRGEGSWVYTHQHSSEGLWDEDVPSRVFAIDRMSRFVLSGMFGEQLLEDSKELRKFAKNFGDSLFDRAILVGGAALAGTSERDERSEVGGSYRGQPESNGLISQTWTGGTIHGDFRTHRYQRPTQGIYSTLNPRRIHEFMPIIDGEQAAAYHGVEPDIVASLLYYKVAFDGAQPKELRRYLLESLARESVHFGGAFGDYGDGDGKRQATLLRMKLDRHAGEANADEVLFDVIVAPQQPHRLELIAKEDGVLFANTHGGETAYSSMFIPANEIEDYVLTLIRGGGGRTSPDAMVRVIDGLVEE